MFRRVLAMAVGVLSLQEGPNDGQPDIGGQWVCRLVPFVVVIPVLRRVIRLVVRLLRRCVRIPILGSICWIVGVQFVLVVSWVIVWVLRVYWRWVCNWVPRPWWRDANRQEVE